MGFARNHSAVEGQLQKGVLDHLAQGGMDPVLASRKISNPLAVSDRPDERSDEERGLVAENVGTEQRARGGICVELADTSVILHRPAVGDVAVFLDRFDVRSPSKILRSGSD